MKLTVCTFTGVDDAVDPKDLAAITHTYPFVEWGVAYNPAQAGKPRYPTLPWIDAFLRTGPMGAKALHLTGAGLSDFIEGHLDARRVSEFFPRLQMNFGAEFKGDEIDNLASRVRSMPQKNFIFPYNETTKEFLPHFERENVSVLFDASCGRGQSPSLWQAPLSGYSCGYAGGLSPDNINTALEALMRIVSPEEKIWVDMESGVRTDNRLDLRKVTIVLESLKTRFFQ